MKTITYITVFTLWFMSVSIGYSQNDTIQMKQQIETLETLKTQIVNQEKEALTKEVATINLRLDKGEISKQEADNLKQEAAELRALNIENRVAIVDNKIALIQRNATTNNNGYSVYIDNDDDSFSVNLFGLKFKSDSIKIKRRYDRRTYSGLVFSFGLNNAIIEGQSLDDSPYRIGKSRYTEIGYSWSTRVFKESNWLRFKYGFSFQFNGLSAIDNLYQVDTGSETVLLPFKEPLNKSKFRMDNLVVPVFFEIGPSRKIEKDDYFRYRTDKHIKIGFGGYAGFNLSTRQKLKYNVDGDDVKEKSKSDFNTNNFVYGLAGYIGYSDISLYAKYDINPIFKGNAPEQRNVSLGVRWDWD